MQDNAMPAASIRALTQQDLDAVVSIDAAIEGQARRVGNAEAARQGGERLFQHQLDDGIAALMTHLQTFDAILNGSRNCCLRPGQRRHAGQGQTQQPLTCKFA